MGNILSYLGALGSRPFSDGAFNEVDNLILSQLAYIKYDAVRHMLPASLHTVVSTGLLNCSETDEQLIQKAAAAERFSGAILMEYESRLEEKTTLQFSAVTFLLPDGTAYISFRGTDNTLIGWKEDFNLAFISPVPAQTEAVNYLNRIARLLRCPLRVGGHSKGGNLAVYAAAMCASAVQNRILAVYNNDGPGHDPSTLASDGYRRIESRIRTFIPRSSIVGMLLEHSDRYTIVDSDARGLFQHYPYSWLVTSDRFQTVPNASGITCCMSESIRMWLKGMDENKRRYMIDTLYEIICASEAKTIKELKSNAFNFIPVFKKAAVLNSEDRRELAELSSQFLKIAAQQYGTLAMEHADAVWAHFGAFRSKIKNAIEEKLQDGGKL